MHAGTLYTSHIKDSPDIDASTAWIFPSWSHMLIPFFAVGIHKGGVDFDDINARMAPDNRATAALVLTRLENWDNEKQLSAINQFDQSGGDDIGWRHGTVNMNP